MRNSSWVYGCGKEIQVHIPRGFGYRSYTVECGSTAHDGGVNQCSQCSAIVRVPPIPDYGDIEHMDDLDYRREAEEADALDILESSMPPPARIWEVSYADQSILGWAYDITQLERFFPGATYKEVTDGRNNTIFDLRGY